MGTTSPSAGGAPTESTPSASTPTTGTTTK
jgi:hypothetical protein